MPVHKPFVELISHPLGGPFKPSKEGDVGHDLYVIVYHEEMTWLERLIRWYKVWKRKDHGHPNLKIVWPFSMKMAHSGVHVNMPNDTWCHVVARSSTARKKLMVLGGIIDSGYQGELFAVLGNFSFIPRLIVEGERYAQVIFHQATRPNFHHAISFSSRSERGGTGFGSTGS